MTDYRDEDDYRNTYSGLSGCPDCHHPWYEVEDGVCQGIVTVNGQYVSRVCGCTRGRGDGDE
jgi:hypothetical protein